MTIDREEANRKTKHLADQFNTILFGANDKETKFYAPKAGSGFGALSAAILDHQQQDSTKVISPHLWELSNDRVKLLGALYLSLDTFGRSTLAMMATHALNRKNTYARYSALLSTFVAKYVDFDEATKCVIDNLALDEISLNTLRAFSNMLKYDPLLPSDRHLDRLPTAFLSKWKTLKADKFEKKPTVAYTPSASEVMYDRVKSNVMRIVQQAQEIKLQRLRHNLLNDANLEINQDRETLTTGLARLGFGKELIESLEHAEAEYKKAESKFDFKTSADHNRSFFDALLWEAAQKVAAIRKITLTARQKFPAEVRDFLLTTGFFSDRLHKLSEAFYQFASEQSTHQLVSGREIARIVRNMNIELGLLIIKRLESFT